VKEHKNTEILKRSSSQGTGVIWDAQAIPKRSKHWEANTEKQTVCVWSSQYRNVT